MAGAGAIRAGRAFVEFFADDSKLVRGMRRIDKNLQSWGKQVTAVGTAVAAAGLAVLSPLVGAAAMFESMGSALNDMSMRTGASVEALSSLGFAASQSGASMEDVETGLKKMSKFAFAAASGNKEAILTLNRLGLKVSDIAKLAPEEMFRRIATEIGAIQNPTARAAMAMQVFGKTGTALLPMIAEMEALEARARELGIIMSTEDAQAADKLGDSWGELKAVGKALVFQVGAALAPMLTNLITKAAETGAAFIQWVRDNRELIMTIAKIAGIVVAVGAGIAVLGGIVYVVGAAFGVLATIVAGVAAVVGFLISAFSFLISPIGLVLASLAGLVVAFFMFTDMGKQALDFIAGAFANFSADAIQAWHGIRDALGKGDIGQAMVVVGTFLTLQWAKVVAFMWQKWADFLNFMMPSAQAIALAIAATFIDMSAAIADAFLLAVEAIQKMSDLVKDILVGMNPLLAPAFAAMKGIDVKGERNKVMVAAVGAKIAAGVGIAAGGAAAVGGADAAAAAALDNANKAKIAFDDAVKAAQEPGKKFNPNAPQMNIGDLRDGLEQSKAAVSGTFSASAAAGLAGDSKLDKVADNTDDMRKSLKTIALKPVGMGVM
jgi:hypothetical protein